MCRPPDITPQVPSRRRLQQNNGASARWDGEIEAGFDHPPGHEATSGNWGWNDLVASGIESQFRGNSEPRLKKSAKVKKPTTNPLVLAALKGVCPPSSFQQQPQGSWGSQKAAGTNTSASQWMRPSTFLPQMDVPNFPNLLQQIQQGLPTPSLSRGTGMDGLSSLESWAMKGTSGLNQMNPNPGSTFVAQGFPLGAMPDVELAEGFGVVGQEYFTDDDQELDEKKYKRMMSNRASAKRSRQRRQVRLDELEIQSAKLRVENAAVQRKLNEANEQIQKYQQQNEALQEELLKLRSELKQERTSASSGDCLSAEEGSNGHPEHSCNGDSNLKSGAATKIGACGKRKHEGACSGEFENESVLETKPFCLADRMSYGHAGNGSEVSGAGEGNNNSYKTSSPIRESSPSLMVSGDDAIDPDFFSSLMECFDGKPFDSLLV